MHHKFGGNWTVKKLGRLEGYLTAYMKIFTENEGARFFTTNYIDAFAGTGYRAESGDPSHGPDTLFDDDDLCEVASYGQGSAQIALEIPKPFDKYTFIEKDPDRASALENLKQEYPKRAGSIEIITGDANEELQTICQETNWSRNRAVAFLDPYGMQVEWSTLEAIANTQAIDMWLLFPLGQAINRLLTRNKIPEGALAERLTEAFGTEEWREAFYRPNLEQSLFSSGDQHVMKDTDFEGIAGFFLKRLGSIFHSVAPNHYLLRNSKNVPLYLLCFAAGNPRGTPTAIRIANYLLKQG